MNVKRRITHSATVAMVTIAMVTMMVAAAVLVVSLPCASADGADTLCGYKPLEIPEDPSQGNSAFISEISCVQTNALTDPPVGSLPPAYDARDLKYVTPVRDQSSCGSCWIFAAVADVESGVAIREPRSLPDYSEQEIGDCNIWSSVGGYDFCRAEMRL